MFSKVLGYVLIGTMTLSKYNTLPAVCLYDSCCVVELMDIAVFEHRCFVDLVIEFAYVEYGKQCIKHLNINEN